MPTAVQVYDFEGVMEQVIAAVFISNGMKCLTPKTATTELQKFRPRFEVVFKVGSAQPKGPQGQRILSADGTLIQRDVAYKGEFAVEVITNSQETDKTVHTQYRATARYLMPMLPMLVNGTGITDNNQNLVALFNHRINFVTETGTSLMFRNTDGTWSSSIVFAIDFAIQATAIQNLTLN